MEPLRRIIGDARIVSLGEATHGTREFFQLKHRMLEFLATQMGFTIFSIEANMPEAYRLNEYVLNGAGDPAELLRGMYFWTWNTEEVLDMIRWMREFNASGGGPVQFTGFDMQTTPVAAEIVRAYVERVDPAYEPTVREAAVLADPRTAQARAFDRTRSVGRGIVTIAVSPATLHATWRAIYDKLRSSSDTSQAARWATQNARVVVQATERRARGPASRDQSMAENVKWILEQNPNAKIVLWAHNGHVAAERVYKPMGAFLREAYGSEMVVFGFAFNRGSFRAVGRADGRSTGLQEHSVGPADTDSFDAMLASANVPVFALDLRQPPPGAVASWLDGAPRTRWVGSVFDSTRPEMHMTPITPRTFDAVLFVDTTTSARGLSMR